MKLLFALTLCSAAFPHFREADTGGGTSTGWTPPPAPPAGDANPTTQIPGTEGSAVDAAGLTSDQGGVHQAAPTVEQTGVTQEAPESPLQDGAKVHEGAVPPIVPGGGVPVQEAKPLVMPPDVRAAFVGLITETLEKIEAKKLEEATAAAQAPQPHGGIGSPAAAVEAKFQSHALNGDKREMVQRINDAAKALALAVEEFVPAGKEKDFAHGAIMQAAMFANSAISRS